ncbi:hypothetical protein [Streptomyces marispadix]|uniref:Uncharacterized protein n=1 Tax=Streptomyces marispadix TaxID=2922868 RepID=A0ABS9SUP2_9ACTN|nr:hypothetical protein [Streptomyces marispadix]MCH6159985.1 hypothetical protein [Streptomyces marispadix]
MEQAQSALVEHYPRLVRLAYLVLPPSLDRHRRVLTAHSLVQRALPRGRGDAKVSPLPAQRHAGADGGTGESAGPGAGKTGKAGKAGKAGAAAETVDVDETGESTGESTGANLNTDGTGVSSGGPRGGAYAYLTTRVLRAALAGERQRRLGPWRLPPLPVRPGLFPLVLGLRLFPRSGGAYELALEKALSEVSGAARAACALRGWEGMTEAEVCRVLEAAEVEDPAGALAEGAGIRLPEGSNDRPLPGTSEFDPCSLQARPTDLLRRRQHLRAVFAAVAAVAVCGALLGLPGDSWGPDGAAAPPYARNPAAEMALDPGSLTRAAPGVWKRSSRTDFSAWPARGDLTRDHELLRRALNVWARPGDGVRVSVTRGTAAGPPSGPPQLLYAGRIDGTRVVMLHDGLRVARYSEPEGADSGGATLDIARTDGAGTADSGALVVNRSDSNVRYLTAPWVSKAAEVDLLQPDEEGRPLSREDDGVLTSLTGADAGPGGCHRWPGLLLSSRDHSTRHLYTDLGELTPARITGGNPGKKPKDATGAAARERLSNTACGLRTMLGAGVRSVNSWQFATQSLPGGAGSVVWSCTRGETWRGRGARVLTGFRQPGTEPGEQSTFTSRAVDTPACGPREPHALSGGLWKSRAGEWYVLAAGSRKVTAISVSGKGKSRSLSGTWPGRRLVLSAQKGAKAKLTAKLSNGEKLGEPR